MIKALRFRLLVLLLALGICFAVSAQVDDDAAILEADFAVPTAEAPQHAVELQSQSAALRTSGNLVQAARTLNRVGRFQIRMSALDEAVLTFQEALHLLEQQSDTQTRIDNLNGLASSYENLSKCDLAEPVLELALTLSRQINYIAGQAEALWVRSDCEATADQALVSARKSLELWQSIGRKRGMAQAYMTIAKFQMVQSNLTESSQSLDAARNLYRELNSLEGQSRVLIYFGFIEYRRGAWQNALAFFAQAASLIDEKSEPFRMGQIATGLGEAFLESGSPQIALGKFREALEHYARSHDGKAQTETKWQIGRAQYFSGAYEAALESFLTAREEAAARRNARLVAFCDDFLGRTKDALHDPSAALKYFQAALAGFKQAKNPMETARTLVLIGGIEQRQGKIDGAREKYQSALGSFSARSDRVNESATLYALGALELSQNHLDEAEGYLKKSIDVTENVRRVSSSRDLTVAISASMHDRYESYVECLMREHRAHPDRALDVRAFETSELARARSLAELLRATQTDLIAGVEPELGKRETALRQSLRVKEDARVTLLGTNYEKKDLDVLDRELAQLEEQYKQVTELIRAKYPAYEQLTAPGPLNLRQIQTEAIVDDQTLLLEFELGVERSYVWAVTRGEFSSYDLPARAEIERASHRVYELLTANQPKAGETPEQHQTRLKEAELQLPPAIAELSSLLLAPVAGKLGNKRLLIVADGVLQYIPFSALIVPQKSDSTNGPASFDKDRPLALDHEVVNEPSASILALLLNQSAKRTRAQKSVAVLADPVFERDDPRITSPEPRPTAGKVVAQELEMSRAFGDTDQLTPAARIPRLLGSREEAGAIMNIVPWRTGFEAVDFAASRATVIGSQLDQYSIVHFATHAVLNENHPESSGIVLSLVNQAGGSEEGFLRIDDIYNLKLPVNLVVLSACNSALGKDVRGEGLIGLTRGFMYAGASSVTASLWKVDDEATAELMKRFYVGMFQKQLAPAAALREAQIGMWQTKRWHAPYYWAAFVIQGEYNQSVAVPRNFPWSMLLAVVAILSLATFSTLLILRKRRQRIASGTMGG